MTIYAHPNPNSFCHAVLDRFTAGLKDAGHESGVIDLYAIRFAPVFGTRFPAILKGWIERALAHGFTYYLTPEGWRGDLEGRVPLLDHEKALVINTTFFGEADYEAAGLRDAMTTVIDDFGLRYPGVKEVEHVYFHAVSGVDDEIRQGYLQRAYRLGREFAE